MEHILILSAILHLLCVPIQVSMATHAQGHHQLIQVRSHMTTANKISINFIFHVKKRLYSELFLDTQKNHVRRFAVESFSFLLRKVGI